MKYDEEFNDGAEAYHSGYRRHFNPHVWQTVSWYAWDAGWARAQHAERWFDGLEVVSITPNAVSI